MYKHILIATDGSDLALKAVEQGLALGKALGASMTAVTVTEPWAAVLPAEMAIGFSIDAYQEAAAARTAWILSDVAKRAEAAGVKCETIHVKEQFPAEGIVATAIERNCDLIVMASHGRRGLKRILLGSQAINVVTQTTVSVLICR
jgi:nucleotide-binding universal stress UspA family protein